jgi:sigma-B regulation protein RsbU (phosphoserine phosphatase)
MYPGTAAPPSDMLDFVSRHLAGHYVESTDSFVTAFYSIYDPHTRELTYSSAGHNPPRLKHCAQGTITALDGARSLPLGVSAKIANEDAVVQLQPGDQIVFYTDGITEATDSSGRQFGVDRLDAVLTDCRDDAGQITDAILQAVDQFSGGQPALDDRTVIVAKVS